MEANNQDKMVLQQFLSGVWWLVLLRGIAVGILGCLLLTRPAITVLVIVQFMGIYWLVDGIFTLARSIRGRKTHKNWGWGIFVGVLGMLAGLVVLSRPLASAILTQLFLVYFLGITAIVSGITSIITGFPVLPALLRDFVCARRSGVNGLCFSGVSYGPFSAYFCLLPH
jgi:uncharacterized membrane protein HdeD (DUF308 family)